MSRLLALLIFSSIFLFNFYSGDSVSKGISVTDTLTATPTPNVSDDSFSMELDRNTFIISCPPGYMCSQGAADSAPIVVTVFNNKHEDNSLRYKYTTSGGRVIGKGAKVNLDFPNAPPGTYQIMVVIEDKAGKELQKITKTITVLSYQDDGDRCLGCPELSVDAPTTPTQAGETMIFTANVIGGTQSAVTYNWTVSSGKIIEGQGTPVIRVATNPKIAGKVVKAIANFKWHCSEVCNSSASASGLVATKKRKGK